jgi:LysM repeat protein
MNNPNPFIPQGSLVEQMNKKRARVKMAVLAIFSGTILLIAPVLLIQGCKRDQSSSDNTTTPDASSTADTNPVAATPNLSATQTPATTETNASTNNNMATTMPMQPMQPAAQPVTQPTAPAASTYVIVPHDTYATIAKKFSVKVKDLEAVNPTMAANKLKIGSTINIPASGSASPTSSGMATTTDSSSSSNSDDVYTVKAGDNLTKIAHNAGTTYKAIMALNNMTSTRINVGQKLKLPAKTTTAAASPMETMPAATTTTTASNPTSGAPVMR